MNSVITIPALGDNYVYLYVYGQGEALAVDPGESSSLLKIIQERRLNLKMVLVTHHHLDHVGGIAELKQSTGCTIIGSDRERIRGIDRVVEDGQILAIGNTRIRVIATPGHTCTAVCYYIPPSNENKNGILWTGDTLFVGGCGRLLECDAKTMWESLRKLASLPEQTLIYCGHDYTLENYEFALTIEPDNETVKNRFNEIKQAQSQGRQTVPSTMFQETVTNLFLRSDTIEMKDVLEMPRASSVEVFAELRRRKDVF